MCSIIKQMLRRTVSMIVENNGFTGQINLPGAQHIAISPSGHFALVCVPDLENIVVIDTRSGQVVARMSVGGRANNGVFSLDGRFAYIALREKIVEIRTSDWSESRQINLGGSYMGMGTVPAEAYALSFDKLVELDLGADPQVKRFVAFNKQLFRLAVSAEAACAVFDDYSSVYALDLKDWTQRTIVAGGGLALLALSSDGGRAYVSNGSLQIVQIYEVASGEIIASLPFKGSAAAVAQNDAHVFILVSADASMKIINVEDDFKVVGERFIGGDPKYVAVTPDHSRVYVSNGSVMQVFDTTEWVQ